MVQPNTPSEEDAMLTEDQQYAMEEFQHAAWAHCKEPSVGTRYALEMAAAEVQLLGLDPSRISPDGYEPEADP